MAYKVLLADADGTLFDFLKGEAISISETLRAFGIPDTPENVRLYSQANDAQWKKLERGQTTAEKLRVDRFSDFLSLSGYTGDPVAMCADFVRRLGQQRWLLPGAAELCRRVSRRMPIYLVTNGMAAVQRSRLHGSEVEPYISGMVVSEEVGYAKPNPKMLFEALRRAGCRAQEAVLLGDSVTADIAAARSAAIDSILFTNGREPAKGHGATWTAATLEEACERILNEAGKASPGSEMYTSK